MSSLYQTNIGRWFLFFVLSLLVVEVSLYRIILHGVGFLPSCYSIEGSTRILQLSALSNISKFSYLIFKIGALGGLIWLFLFTRTFSELLNYPRSRISLNFFVVLLAHILSLVAVGYIRASQRGTCFSNIESNQAVLAGMLFFFFLALASTFLLILAPLDYWISYFKKKWRGASIVVFLVVGLSIFLTYGFSPPWLEHKYNDLLFQWTAYFVNAILGQIGYATIINYASHIISINNFTIIVEAPCLGYQGVTIALAVLTLYFIVYRKNYRFPNVLLLYPVAVLILFFANSVRIVLLLIIGANISPDIAVNGFHSVAGWLNLIMILGLSILVANRLPFFTKDAAGIKLDLSKNKIRLAPEVLLILISLVSLMLTAKFEWAYPLRVIIVGVVLWRWWPKLGLVFSNKLVLPIVTGVIVFTIWIEMVPVDSTRSAEFHQTLTSVPVWLMLLWIAFRLIGAVVVVPLAEELAFRGYLFDASDRLLKQYVPSLSFSYSNGHSEYGGGGHAVGGHGGWLQTVLVLAATSIVFGILHSAWLVGIIAGIAFGLVRLYRNNLMDAVIAHGVTNLLLAVYVLYAGAWSLW